MKHFTKQSISLCSLHGKIGIQMNNTVYTSKEKNYEFSSKKTFCYKNSPPPNVYYMEFYRNFLFEYSLIGIVKPKFTRRNEIWCRIWEKEDLSKNVHKKQDRSFLSPRKDDHKVLVAFKILNSWILLIQVSRNEDHAL